MLDHTCKSDTLPVGHWADSSLPLPPQARSLLSPTKGRWSIKQRNHLKATLVADSPRHCLCTGLYPECARRSSRVIIIITAALWRNMAGWHVTMLRRRCDPGLRASTGIQQEPRPTSRLSQRGLWGLGLMRCPPGSTHGLDYWSASNYCLECAASTTTTGCHQCTGGWPLDHAIIFSLAAGDG